MVTHYNWLFTLWWTKVPKEIIGLGAKEYWCDARRKSADYNKHQKD